MKSGRQEDNDSVIAQLLNELPDDLTAKEVVKYLQTIRETSPSELSDIDIKTRAEELWRNQRGVVGGGAGPVQSQSDGPGGLGAPPSLLSSLSGQAGEGGQSSLCLRSSPSSFSSSSSCSRVTNISTPVCLWRPSTPRSMLSICKLII